MAIIQHLKNALQALTAKDKEKRAALQAQPSLSSSEEEWLDSQANYTDMAMLIEALEAEEDADAVYSAMQKAGTLPNEVSTALAKAETLQGECTACSLQVLTFSSPSSQLSHSRAAALFTHFETQPSVPKAT